jgi:hypothetical protein
MRLAETILIVAMAVGLGGCVVRKQPTAKAAPAAPKPVAAAAPAPAPEPLSIPQTNVTLPPPQPVSPEALATTLPAGEPPPPPPAPSRNTSRPAPRPGGTPQRTEPATPAPATPPAVETERPAIVEVTPKAELIRLQEEAETRRREVAELIRRIPRNRLRQQQGSVDRINTFLKQAEDAERRGDMRQASELAGRAAVLARELK